jgi:Pectate lyase superfamily protein
MTETAIKQRDKFIRGLFIPAAAASVVLGVLFTSGAAQAASKGDTSASATAKIQALLNAPVNNTVNLPSGTFTIEPTLQLRQGVRIVGHNTTLKVAKGVGDYKAILSAATSATSLAGLSITGITFDQNTAGNQITNTSALFQGKPRFVIWAPVGNSITITGNRFIGLDGVDAIVTGGATSNVRVSKNVFQASNPLGHDTSTIYTSGTGTTISDNTMVGSSMRASAAIEVHGSQVKATGNSIRGYLKAINVVASQTNFSGNNVTDALNPVDLWSIVAPGLTNVTIRNNYLGRNLSYWSKIYGASMPSAQYTQMVVRDPSSKFPFTNITVSGNRG